MATLRGPETRARDSDRNAVCEALDTALAEGQLTIDEHRQRVARATSATKVADLTALLTDLQLPRIPTAAAPRMRLPRWGIAAAAAIVVVLIGTILWGTSRNTSHPMPAKPTTAVAATRAAPTASTTSPTPAAPQMLHSVAGVTALLDSIRKKFGDTKGYELSVYTDYAELRRPDTGDDRLTARWHYEAGVWTGPGQTPNLPVDVAVDLSAFDVKAVLGVMRGVPGTMGVKRDNVLRTYFTVAHADDPTAPQAVTVRIDVSTSFGDGEIDLDGAGNVKRVKQPF